MCNTLFCSIVVIAYQYYFYVDKRWIFFSSVNYANKFISYVTITGSMS